MKARKANINTPTDHKKKKKMSGLQGSANMSGPEKLLSASKPARGAAKKTGAKRVNQKKTVY